MDTGQAGVLGGPLAKDAGGLRFDTRDDALNFARDCRERMNNWRGSEPKGRVEDYVSGRDYIAIHGRVGRDFANSQHTPRRAPFGQRRHSANVSIAGNAQAKIAGRKVSRAENPMGRLVPKLVQNGEEWIPSVVWFECEHEGDDVFVHVTALAATQVVLNVIGFRGEEEFGSLRFVSGDHQGAGVDRMVERVSQSEPRRRPEPSAWAERQS